MLTVAGSAKRALSRQTFVTHLEDKVDMQAHCSVCV